MSNDTAIDHKDIIGPNSTMLRSLRIKFVAINMLSISFILITTLAVILYANYNQRITQINDELEGVIALATHPQSNQLSSTQRLTTGDPVPVPSAGNSYADANRSSRSSDVSAPTIGSGSMLDSSVILMSVYSVSPSGRYTTLSNYTNAKISESVILGANEDVLESSSQSGYLSDYNLFYVKRASTSIPGDYVIAYADGSSMNDWRNLAVTLVIVGIFAFVALFLINIFFSRWAMKPVRTSIKKQQQFTADASHELKTPLTVILANTAILKSKPDATVEEQIQWVESTQLEAERMQLLVNDMLALLRPSEKKQPVAMDEIDFSDLVEGEVLQFESVAFELGVMIEDDISEGIRVMGNADRLARMVAILIDNACKYAAEGTDVSVTLVKESSSSTVAEKAVLKVRNEGNPISEEDLPHIFDRFYRADKARTSSKGSYGLGLAIGQEIAHEHDGVIEVESSADSGTVFTVTLPAVD